MVTTGAVKTCKAPDKCHPAPTNRHRFSLQAGCPLCRATNSVKALNGERYTVYAELEYSTGRIVITGIG